MGRVLPVVDGVAFQDGGQVLGGGVGVAQVKLHQLAFLQHLADGQHAAPLVHAHHVADQEVALLRFVDEGIHDHAQEQGVLHQVAVPLPRLLEDAAQHVDRLLAVQLHQEVAVAAGDAHRLADGTATLRHHRLHDDVAGKGDAHRARVVVILPQEEAVLPRPLSGAGQPADLGGGGIGVVHAQQQVLRREGHGVGQQDELRLIAGINPDGLVPVVGAGVQAGQVVGLQPQRVDVDPGQAGDGQRHRRLLLHLGAPADDAAAGTAENRDLRAKHLGDQFGHGRVVGGVLG